MIDAALLPYLKRLIDRPARFFHALGVSADQITLFGFGVGLAGFLAAAFGMWMTALVLLLINRICDGLDGAVARLSVPTDRGAFLDIALDFAFYALFPLGFAFQNPGENALAAAVLVTSFVGTGSSFLAFSIIADRKGLTSNQYPSKGLYYLGGLTEGTETIGFFVLICLAPQWFWLLAYVFAAACAVTTLTRWVVGWKMF